MERRELEERVTGWLALRKAEGLRPTTLQTYADHVRIFLRALGDRELTPAVFADIFRAYGEGHSPASCRTIFISTKLFLKGIDRVDLAGSMKKPRADVPPKVIYTEAQMQTIWNVLRNDGSATGLRDHAVIGVLYYCGLRVSEVCALQIDDLLGETEAVQVRGGKTRFARRIVPLVEPAPEIIAAYIGRGRPRLIYHHTDCLFLGIGGEPTTRDTIRQMLRRRGEQVGFPLGAHRFRHTWTTNHCRARTNPAIIGQLAGWSPKSLLEMMVNYNHADIEDLRKAQQAAFGPVPDLAITRRTLDA